MLDAVAEVAENLLALNGAREGHFREGNLNPGAKKALRMMHRGFGSREVGLAEATFLGLRGGGCPGGRGGHRGGVEAVGRPVGFSLTCTPLGGWGASAGASWPGIQTRNRLNSSCPTRCPHQRLGFT